MKYKHLLLGLATPKKGKQIKPPLKVKTRPTKKTNQQTPNNSPKNHHNQKNYASSLVVCYLTVIWVVHMVNIVWQALSANLFRDH